MITTPHLNIIKRACGDFNAHHTLSGGLHDSSRGSALLNTLLSEDHHILNDRSPTFFRSGATPSVLDLTVASREVSFSWSAQPDLWGSDHVPIHLKYHVMFHILCHIMFRSVAIKNRLVWGIRRRDHGYSSVCWPKGEI